MKPRFWTITRTKLGCIALILSLILILVACIHPDFLLVKTIGLTIFFVSFGYLFGVLSKS